MTKLILSTSNIVNGGPSIVRRPASEKSNVELINALRSNFLSSKNAFTAIANTSSPTSRQEPNGRSSSPLYTEWTSRENGSLFVPTIDFSQTGLAEERSQYDITVKLFFLPGTSAAERCKHAQEAVDLVLQELHMPSIDLLIVSFPGVSLDADDDEEKDVDWNRGDEGHDIVAMTKTWKALEYLRGKGLAQRIGLAEFGTERLKRFLPTTKIRPSVDQINVRDYYAVPKALIHYAKQEKIELLTHNDCTDILPSGAIRDLLGTSEKGAGVLVGVDEESDGLKGDIKPQWVVKYTAVVHDRGVIENKGYFAMAEIQD